MNRPDLGRDLIETDSEYFEMAALTERIAEATLAWMPDRPQVPAACVVHRVDPDAPTAEAPARIDAWERRIRSLGFAHARVYLTSESAIDSSLAGAGYRRREEIGFLSPDGFGGAAARVHLRPVNRPSEWRLKQSVHEECGLGPDGYRTPCGAWVEMERAKCETGRMSAFLIEERGVLRGTACAIETPTLVRLKNLVVSPDGRRRGIGTHAILALRARDAAAEPRRIGVFALDGSDAGVMYDKAGLSSATRLIEWSKPL